MGQVTVPPSALISYSGLRKRSSTNGRVMKTTSRESSL